MWQEVERERESVSFEDFAKTANKESKTPWEGR